MGETFSPQLLARYPVVDRQTMLMTRPWIQWMQLLGAKVIDDASSMELTRFLQALETDGQTQQALRDQDAVLLGLQAHPERQAALLTRIQHLEALVLGMQQQIWRQAAEGLNPWLMGLAPSRRDATHAVLAQQWAGYATGSFTITGTGFTVNPTGTARWTKALDQVTIFLPTLTGTSNATTFTLTGIPATIQPAQTGFSPAVRHADNGTDAATGFVRFNSGSGIWDVFPTAALGPWTGSGTKTLYAVWLSYHLL